MLAKLYGRVGGGGFTPRKTQFGLIRERHSTRITFRCTPPPPPPPPPRASNLVRLVIGRERGVVRSVGASRELTVRGGAEVDHFVSFRERPFETGTRTFSKCLFGAWPPPPHVLPSYAYVVYSKGKSSSHTRNPSCSAENSVTAVRFTRTQQVLERTRNKTNRLERGEVLGRMRPSS